MSKPLKIFHLISSASFYGAERVAVELCSYCQKLGVEMRLVVLLRDDALGKRFQDALKGSGVQVLIYKNERRFDWNEIISLGRQIREFQADIVHSHGYKSDIYSALIKRFFCRDVSLFATNHTWRENTLSERIYRFLDIRVLRRFEKIVAVSEEVKEEMLREKISAGKIEVVRNGVDLEDPEFQVAKKIVRQKLNIEDEVAVIGCVARLAPEKKQEMLIRVLPDLLQKGVNPLLFLVGDGPERSRLEAVVSEKKLEKFVRFFGTCATVRQLYRVFDVFALVSTLEGLPMALLEAMAVGCPVVASRVGAIPDVVADGKNGLLVEPGDQDGVTAAISFCLMERETALVMGESGKQSVARSFSARAMAQHYLELYRSVCSK